MSQLWFSNQNVQRCPSFCTWRIKASRNCGYSLAAQNRLVRNIFTVNVIHMPEGKETIEKKNSSFDHWKKKIRNRRLFDPIFFIPPQGIFGKSGRSSMSPLSCKTEKVKFSSYSCKLKLELIWNLAGSLIQGYLSYGKTKKIGSLGKKKKLKVTLHL